MNDWVVVPVKSIANGKSRLVPILGRPRRQRLNRALLFHTLALASGLVGERRVIVVSRCEEARKIAMTFGSWVLREPRNVGLNRALGLARDHAVSRGATGVLILPCDLPLATLPDLRHVLLANRSGKPLLICRDRHGRGTNALYLERPSKFKFRFGENSAAAHSDEAEKVGRRANYMDIPRLGFDLDTPTDYRDLTSMNLRARTDAIRKFEKLAR